MEIEIKMEKEKEIKKFEKCKNKVCEIRKYEKMSK